MVESGDLAVFPFVSAQRVDEYNSSCEAYAEQFSIDQSLKDFNRSKEKIFANTVEGFRAKVAATLIKGLDPLEEIDFDYRAGTFNTFVRDSDIMKIQVQEVAENKVKIQMFKDKYSKLHWRIGRGDYACFMEFVHHDRQNGLYYHVGKLNVDAFQVISGNLPERIMLEFNLSDYREENVFILTSGERSI